MGNIIFKLKTHLLKNFHRAQNALCDIKHGSICNAKMYIKIKFN